MRPLTFTVVVPLGKTASTSVVLVRSEGPVSRLLRLKTWHRAAPEALLHRFHDFRAAIGSSPVEEIVPPLSVALDAAGCPSVVTAFRQGVPILDRVRGGRLGREEAVALLAPLLALTERAHARGLVHGSIVPGNVMVETGSGRAHLLDFGLNALMQPVSDPAMLASADLEGFATLVRTLREIPIQPAPTPRR